jgi:type VI secretion system protein ImpF
MPPPNANNRLLPSIFDRLTDPEAMGTASAPGYDPREMMDSVRADLEELLNSRQAAGDIPAECKEVRESIVAYGLPDLVAYNGASYDQCADLAKLIGGVIARFEPRLKNIRVTVIRGQEYDARSVRFHIDASLNVNPAPDVGFETVIELTTGRAKVTPVA